MFRLVITGLIFVACSTTCKAQPSVTLEHPPEQICRVSGDPVNWPAVCPGLPFAHISKPQADIAKEAAFLPKGFDQALALAAADDERGEGFYVFGQTATAAGAPYLAFAPKETYAAAETWEFFTGRGLSGSTNWVGLHRWQIHTDAQGLWNPGDRAKLFAPEAGCGAFQVSWNSQLGRWLVLYGCDGITKVRVAFSASGPWSEPTTLGQTPQQTQPLLLDQSASQSSTTQDSRATTIFWAVETPESGQLAIMRATLRQVGAN